MEEHEKHDQAFLQSVAEKKALWKAQEVWVFVEFASFIGRGGAYRKDFCGSVKDRSREFMEKAHEGHRSL